MENRRTRQHELPKQRKPRCFARQPRLIAILSHRIAGTNLASSASLASRVLPALILAFWMLATPVRVLADGLLYRLPYSWADERGQVLKLAGFRGKPTVIAMAYGACQKICSTTLRRMEELQQFADRDKTDINFVVVSLAPKLDTPEAWRDFRKWRGLVRSNWTFLSGSDEHTKVLAGLLGISYWTYDDHVLHDFGISLLDTEGNILRKLKWADATLDGFLPARKADQGSIENDVNRRARVESAKGMSK
jgi:protein SCO1/2